MRPQARHHTFRAIERIAAAIRPGMLYTEVAGHRLADFPHKAFHSGPLAAAEFAPSTDLWVLEIQIRHPERPFGAFFEDLLLESDR